MWFSACPVLQISHALSVSQECQTFTHFSSEKEGKKLSFGLWQWGVSADTAITQKTGEWKKSFRRSQRLFAVTTAERCHSVCLFTPSAKPGAPPSQPACSVFDVEESHNGSSSWCISKSQKCDTGPTYINMIRKTVILSSMVVKLHPVMLFREHLLYFEGQLCKYSQKCSDEAIFWWLEKWDYG